MESLKQGEAVHAYRSLFYISLAESSYQLQTSAELDEEGWRIREGKPSLPIIQRSLQLFEVTRKPILFA